MTRAPAAFANYTQSSNQLSKKDGECRRKWCAYLQGEHAHATRSLRQYSISRFQLLALDTVKRIPCRQSCTRQSAGLLKIQACGHLDQTAFFEGAILTQRTIQSTTKPGGSVRSFDRTSKMGLVEESEDFVSFLESGDSRAGSNDSASAVGCRNYGEANGEGVFALWKVDERTSK